MSGELTRWIASNPAEREHDRAIARIDHATSEALARVQAVVGVTQTGVLGALSIEMTKHIAELTLPEASASLQLVANSGVFNVAAIVQRFDGRSS